MLTYSGDAAECWISFQSHFGVKLLVISCSIDSIAVVVGILMIISISIQPLLVLMRDLHTIKLYHSFISV